MRDRFLLRMEVLETCFLIVEEDLGSVLLVEEVAETEGLRSEGLGRLREVEEEVDGR